MTAATDQVAESLRALERELDRQGSPFSSLAAPPVDPRRLDEAEERVGRPFPSELRAWWLWHDGSVPQHGRLSAHLIGAGGFWPYPLEHALGEWEWWSQASPFRDHVVSEATFKESWVPFAGAAQLTQLTAKLELSSSDRLVIGIVEMHPIGDFGATVDLSLAELIEGWIDYLDAGHAWWDPDGDCWRYRVPPPPGYDVRLFFG